MRHFYDVTIAYKYPPCYGGKPCTIRVTALTAAHAKRIARDDMRANGYTSHDGPLLMTAKRVRSTQDGRSEQRTADHIDGYDRDDLGASPDF